MNSKRRYTIAGQIVRTATEVRIIRGLYLDHPHVVAQCDSILRLMAGV